MKPDFFKQTIPAVLFFLCSLTAVAQSNRQSFSFSLGGALEMGGDAIAKVYFTDGGDQSVHVGQGGSLLAGVEQKINSYLSVRGVLGFKYLTTAANNANITLTRFPMRISGVVKLSPAFWLSAGYMTYSGIKFNGDGIIENFTLKTKGGPAFEFGYKNVSLIYNAIKYKDNFGFDYAGNSIGVSFLFPLRKKVVTVEMPAE